MSDRRTTPPAGSSTPKTGLRTDGGRDEPAGDEERTDSADSADSAGDVSVDFTGGGEREDDSDTDASAEPRGDLARRFDERRDAAAGAEGGDADEPFDELDEAWTGEGAVPSDADELFEEMDVSNVDTDALWESVLDDSDAEPVDFGAADAPGDDTTAAGDEESGATSASASEEDEPRKTVVPKDSHCESCHFFSKPPEVACTYEGAEIVEIVDSERFQVENCPVVAGVVDTDGTPTGGGDELATETSD